MLIVPIILKYLLVPLLLILAIPITGLAKKKNAMLNQKKFIFGALLIGLILALPGFLGLEDTNFVNAALYIMEVIYCILGILLLYIIYSTSWFKSIGVNESKPLLGLLLFFSSIIALWLIFLIFNHLTNLNFGIRVGLLPLIAYLPILGLWAYQSFHKIVPPLYKSWTYQTYSNVDWETMDYRKLMGVRLLLKRNPNEVDDSTLRVKAPVEIPLGQWFYRFIVDHNVKFPDNTIIIENESDYFQWAFYERKYFFYLKPLDPVISFKDNNLKDNSIILARRVSAEYNF